MDDSAKNSNLSKQPSLVAGTSAINPGASRDPNRVLASLGSASVAKAKPPRRRYHPGIWIGAVLMFAAGSVSTWLYGNWSSGRSTASSPPAQIAGTESPSVTEPQPDAARILEPTATSTAPVADAASQTGLAPAVPPATPAADAASQAGLAATDLETPVPLAVAAVSSSSSSAFGKARKVKPAKATPGKTVAAAKYHTGKTVVAKRNDKVTINAANADPDASVIEALLRRSSPAANAAAPGALNKGAKTRGAGS